jgi:CDP-glucose 4,6-dehydratase
LANVPQMEGVGRLMFHNAFKGATVLVTGHTGFKGSWLTVWLLKLGARVVGISKDVPTEPSNFEALNLREKIVHYTDDIRHSDRVSAIMAAEKPDFVFHLAAQAVVSRSYRDPLDTLSTNVMGTAHVLDALRTVSHPCAAVIVTSDKCYDNVEWVWGYRETDALGGKDVYSGSKAAAEMIFRSYFHSFLKTSPVRVATARAGNVLGGGDWAADRIVPDCVRAWNRGEEVNIRNPQATRPWQHVLEPLSGYLALAQALQADERLKGESFNFGPPSDQCHTVKRIIEDLRGAWHGEGGRQMCITGDPAAFHEAGVLKLNCDKAFHRLGWGCSLSYPEMIRFVGEWYCAYYQGNEDMLQHTLRQIGEYQQAAAVRGRSWCVEEEAAHD